MRHYSLVVASATLTWAVMEAACVLTFAAVWVVIDRRKKRGVGADRIARNMRSLVGLAMVGCIVAVRLVTHTYN